jgi:hypothetical protein
VLWIERVSVVLLVWGRGEMVGMCVVTAVPFITVLWIQRVRVLWLVWGRGEMEVMCAVTALMLHHSAIGTKSESSVVSVG